LTLIFSLGNIFWIESFDVARATVATTNSRITTHTLERQGQLLGIVATMDLDVVDGAQSVMVRNVDNTVLSIGDSIANFETVLANDAGEDSEMGAHVVVFMRGGQRPAP